MKRKINHLKLLPNTNGFKFLAILKDGTCKEDIVTIDCNGMHKITDYLNTAGWLPLQK